MPGRGRGRRRGPAPGLWAALPLLLMLVPSGNAGSSASCDESQAILSIPGRAQIAGVFDIHSDPECTVEIPSGRQRMAAAVWVVSALNLQLSDPDVEIGLRLYDACSSSMKSQMALVSSTVDADCHSSYSLGVMTTEDIVARLQDLPSTLDVPTSSIDAGRALPLLADTAAALVLASGSNTIDCVVGSSQNLLDIFKTQAAKHELCLVEELVLTSMDDDWVPPVGLCVGLGPWTDVSSLANASSTSTTWLLVPTDGVPTDADLHSLAEGTLVVDPRVDLAVQGNGNGSVSYALFLDVAAGVVALVGRYQAALRNQQCENGTENCNQLPPFQELPNSEDASGSTLKEILEAAGASWLSPAASRVGLNKSRLEKVASFTNGDAVRLVLTSDLGILTTSNASKCTQSSSPDESSDPGMVLALEWRDEPWAAAVAAVCALGGACCSAVLCYLAVRVGRGDILEGRPLLSLLLLMSVLLAMVAALAYCVRAPNDAQLLCAIRKTATCLAYALVFSLMLARALMLAACDADGGVSSSFLSHVNGYLQCALCFLSLLTPAALVLQYWLVTRYVDDACSSHLAFSLQLGCDALLLLMLVAVSPMAARSRRNYREGACFCAAALLCLLIWVGWACAYLLAPPEWRDAALSAGLAATASAVLVAVFIPRTYLMMSAAVRANLASALPTSLAASACVLNSAGIPGASGSQQGLYACVNPDFAGNLYSDRMYRSPPTPGKLTHF